MNINIYININKIKYAYVTFSVTLKVNVSLVTFYR